MLSALAADRRESNRSCEDMGEAVRSGLSATERCTNSRRTHELERREEMRRRRFKVPVLLLWAAAALSLGIGPGICAAAPGGKGVTHDQVLKKFDKVTRADQKAAAKRAKDLGLKPGAAGLACWLPRFFTGLAVDCFATG
jgi:hypothetical protein